MARGSIPPVPKKEGHHDALDHAAARPPPPQPTAIAARPAQEAMTEAAPPQPARPIGRAIQELDDGRRGKGALCGAFIPVDGEALTAPSAGRTTATGGDCLARVEAGRPPARERVEAIRENLSAHRAAEVLWFSLAHPRWEFVFPPK